jgi:molecular chaperone DnaK
LKKAFDTLQTASHKITQDLYKATGAAEGQANNGHGGDAGASNGAGGAAGGSSKGGDDVIDADFKDVN